MRRRYPAGPKINFPLAILAQAIPGLFRRFDALAFGLNVAREFGDIAHYRLGPVHVYQLSHPDYARQVLLDEADRFRKPALVKNAFRPFAGDGLFTSDGALWKRQRKLMQPAFHHRRLAAYGEAMVDQTMRLMESFADGQVRDIGAAMTELTLSVVVRCLFGADVSDEASEIRRAMVAVLAAASHRLNSVLHPPGWLPTVRNIREKRAVRKLDAILGEVIRRRRASGDAGDDLLGMLLSAADDESGAGMSDKQLRDEIMTLFVAGHETTANTLTWTWYLLARHPQIEAEIQDELRRVLSGRAPGMADLPQLPHLEAIVRESLRLYPTAPAVAREAAEDVQIGGYTVAQGSLVTVHFYAVHRDPRFYTEPDACKPARFAAGWEERTPRFAYIPFGAGPRVCIGNAFAMMEVRLILATIAQRYKLSLESGEEVPPTQMVTMRPKFPVRMRFSAR